MSNVAIRVESLGKRYRVGQRERYRALRDVLARASAAPLQRLSSIVRRSLSAGNGRDRASDEWLWALKNVSFEVKRGEVIGIIGRNGAGKTTLLKILSRITKPTEGWAEVCGRTGSLLEVGTGFHPELTGRENVYLSGAILGMRKVEIDRKFDEIVAFAGIAKFIDMPVKRYSSGMYVRLAFAVAAHLEPEILLVDEVLAVGDAAFQKKCLQKMGDVVGEGRTVLFVSHSMAAIQSLCTEALLLDQGSIVSRGKPRAVIGDYLEMISRREISPVSDLQSFPRDKAMELVFTQGYLNGSPLVGYHTVVPEADLEFEFDLHLRHRMRQATIGIHFDDELGVRVYGVNSRWELKRIDLERGQYHVKCIVRGVPLVPGQYYVSVGFSADGRQVDWLEKAARIDFTEYDVYGTGELPWAGQGYFLARADWAISRAEEV